ncbi:oligosaccharide flippase family protein [Acinetobacter baumannii]|nr:oligosaccharide flippase family protein [Acinetobacter baumannii]
MSFLKKAVKFGSGVVLAQLITAASIPLLSRLYSPEDFSLFGVYFSISSILVAFVTLRLETLLPKEQDEGIVYKLNIIINIVYLTLIPLCLIAGFSLYIVNSQLYFKDLFWIFFIVFAAITFSLFNTINILNVRRNEMSLVNKARISRSFISIFFQVILSAVKGGLFLGEVLGRFWGLMYLAKKDYFKINLKIALNFIREKINYIKYALTANFFNILGLNIYPILTLKYYDSVMVGKFFFVQKILSAPVTMISQSVSIALLGDFKKIIEEDKFLLINKMNKISFIFFSISLVLFFLCAFSLEYIESFIFGSQWIGVYKYIYMLIPFLVGQVAFTPFSQILLLVGGEKKQLIWDLTRLILVFLSVFTPLIFNMQNSFVVSLCIYSIANFFMYLIHYFLLIGAIKGFKDE